MMRPHLLVLLALLALPLSSSAQDAPPSVDPTPEPSIDHFVKPDAKIKEITLNCPEKTKQSVMEGAVFCIEVPVPKGFIPVKRGPAVFFHKNGQISRFGHFKDNKSTGVWLHFNEDGTRDAIKGHEAGELHGLYIDFYPNGKRMSEKVFVKGKLHGLSRMWEESGSLSMINEYKDGKTVATWVRRGPDAPLQRLPDPKPR